ncbi:hypothetical protein shn_33275 (plasmid) [Shinella sp. HZN7]|nr:hypothetical protein shn_33275 [Shinella sp. HZN7]
MMPSVTPRLSWSPKFVAGVFEALSISLLRLKGSPRHDRPITTTPTNSAMMTMAMMIGSRLRRRMPF